MLPPKRSYPEPAKKRIFVGTKYVSAETYYQTAFLFLSSLQVEKKVEK